MRAPTLSFVLTLPMLLAACQQPARGGEGESCTKRDDCVEGLRCVSQVCVGESGAAAPVASADPATPAPAQPPAPEPTAEVVRPRYATSEPKQPSVPATDSPGLVIAQLAKGPFESLAVYCKQSQYDCKQLNDAKAGATRVIWGLGDLEVLVIAMEGDEWGMVVLTMDTRDGLYVVDNLWETGAGATNLIALESSSIERGEPGQAEVRFDIFESIRDESDPDLPGYLSPQIETRYTTRLTCGQNGDKYGCTAKQTKSTRLPNK